jgi:putative phosphoribosyl transferase
MDLHTFRNRSDAGRELAKALSAYHGRTDLVVLALPRGGVPVGYEVAIALDAPLDVFLVRKLGLPGHEELAMGAIASGGVRVLNDQVMSIARVSPETLEAVAAREQRELERREREYLPDRPRPDILGRTVILVDDGLATGATMRAAAAAVRARKPTRLVVGVPVGAPETCDELRAEVDDVVCVMTPDPFLGVGRWYDDFTQTTDDEVRRLLSDSEIRSDRRSIASHG